MQWLVESGASLLEETKYEHTPLDLLRMTCDFDGEFDETNGYRYKDLFSRHVGAVLLKMTKQQKAYEMGERLIRDEETAKAASSKRKGKAKKREKNKVEEKAESPAPAFDQLCQEEALKEKVASLQAELDAARGLSLSGLDNAALAALEHEMSKATRRIAEERKKREEELQESKLCVICMTKERNVAFLPCGHVNACRDCANKLQQCPRAAGP